MGYNNIMFSYVGKFDQKKVKNNILLICHTQEKDNRIIEQQIEGTEDDNICTDCNTYSCYSSRMRVIGTTLTDHCDCVSIYYSI